MKIGILTLPLHTNYGGILQTYALQTLLKQMGYEAFFIDRIIPPIKLITLLKCHLGSILHGRGIYKEIKTDQKLLDFYAQKLLDFRCKYIQPSTMPIGTKLDLRKLGEMDFDAFIVGSDQVWRGDYIQGLEDTYFLSFVNNKRVKKIAFAASFGKNSLDLNIAKNKIKYSKCLQQFEAISVRENSGISLCRKEFNVNAVQLVDPTLLLDALEYESLIRKENEIIETGELCVIQLDINEEKNRIIQAVSMETNLKPYAINKSPTNTNQLISIPSWLKSIKDSKYVITDSFHGCVFSIIFNKDFIVIGNEERGIDRFTSLLELFNLSERLVSTEEEALSIILKPIHYSSVNGKINKYRDEAKHFLNKALDN